MAKKITGYIRLQVPAGQANPRSEEHTSELQSRTNLVCRLLLEKKKQNKQTKKQKNNKQTKFHPTHIDRNLSETYDIWTATT